MKKLKISLFTFAILFVNFILAQNTITYTNGTQSVSTNSDTEISVSVLASCSGNQSGTNMLISPTYCAWDSGLISISYSNGYYLTVGNFSYITFKFKKTVTSNQSFTYKFVNPNNGSCYSPDIKITVNYIAPIVSSCSLPYPQNFNISDIQTNSIKYNWNSVPGASSYQIGYTNNWPNWNYIIVNNTQNNYVLNGLLPNNTYQVFVRAICANGSLGTTGFGSTSATGSSLNVTTLCPILSATPTNIVAIPYSSGYKIDFTPIPNFAGNYTLEYFDLVNNSGGAVGSFMPSGSSSYPNFYYLDPSHSFKFRIISNVNCSTSYSSWINVIPTCSLPFSTNLLVTSTLGNGTFSWSTITSAVLYQGEYLVYDLNGNQVSGSFSNTVNSYNLNILTTNLSGTKYVKFRIKSKCSNGLWGDFSSWSTQNIWN